jgi:hypothetical protein
MFHGGQLLMSYYLFSNVLRRQGLMGSKLGVCSLAHYSEADRKSDFDSRNEMENNPPQRKRREMERSSSSYKSSRRRADGLSTDDDLDNTRSNPKRSRPGQ